MKKQMAPEERAALLQDFRSAGRYQFIDPLGEGGYGHVTRHFDTHLNRTVALKTLNAESQHQARRLRSLINEARLISYIDHPGVVSIYDAFVNENDEFCYTMKVIEGEDLGTILMRQGDDALTLPQSLQIFTRICETLAFVHDKGVIHLDLKPNNVMVGEYGQVMVVDWGNARLYDPSAYSAYLGKHGSEWKASDLEEVENFVSGTPPFMSPEQTKKSRNELMPSSDIFSAGVLLYQILTNRYPFSIQSIKKFLDQLHNADPPPPHKLRPNVPRRLSQICCKMLEKNIDERYQTFREVLQDLEDFSNSGQAFATQRYNSGEVIFYQGDEGDYAFQIVSGLIEITAEVDGERRFLATLGEGQIVGELAIFNKQPRTATATALVPSIIKIMTKRDIEQELEKLSPWVGRVIAGLSGKFVNLNSRYLQLEARLDEKS
jgi:serine/threonine-protein kinase